MLAGNVALENAGFRTFGFGAGREDVWEPDLDVDWGDEKEWLAHRHPESLAKQAIGATEMGLIYVNPEGPNASGEPLSAAAAIRATFGNMAMDDEEIVALIAGGHTLGKTHGAAETSHVGAEPEAAPLEAQGLGWHSSYGSGAGADAITSGLEVVWTQTPTQWSNYFFENLLNMNGCRPAARLALSSSKPKTRRKLSRIRLIREKAQTDHAGHRPDPALRPGV
jgi:catalase-peroxidase